MPKCLRNAGRARGGLIRPAGPPLPGVLKSSAGKSHFTPRPRISSSTCAAALWSMDPRVPWLPVSHCTHWDAQRGCRLRVEEAVYHGSSDSSGSAGLLLEAVVDVAVVSLGGAACVSFQLLLLTGLKAHRAGKAELGVFEKPSQTQCESCRRKKTLENRGVTGKRGPRKCMPFPLGAATGGCSDRML